MKYKDYVNSMINPFKSHKKFPYNILEFPHNLWFYIREKWYNFKYGFHTCELWSLEYSFANWILPRLIKFKEVHNGVPNEFVNKANGDVDKGDVLWCKVLDDMIIGFTILCNEEYDPCFEEWKEYEKIVDKAKKLFSKYLKNLWW